MLQVRGAAVASILRAARVHLAGGNAEEFRSRLAPALRPLLESGVDPGGWVPASDLAALMEAYAAVLGADPARTWWDLGRLSCDDTLTDVFRRESGFASPEFVLRRAASLWREFYDRGDFEVAESSPGSGAVRVSGAGFPHPALCSRIGGWIERAVELAGGREGAVTPPVCGFRRGEAEEWRATWKR